MFLKFLVIQMFYIDLIHFAVNKVCSIYGIINQAKRAPKLSLNYFCVILRIGKNAISITNYFLHDKFTLWKIRLFLICPILLRRKEKRRKVKKKKNVTCFVFFCFGFLERLFKKHIKHIIA